MRSTSKVRTLRSNVGRALFRLLGTGKSTTNLGGSAFTQRNLVTDGRLRAEKRQPSSVVYTLGSGSPALGTPGELLRHFVINHSLLPVAGGLLMAPLMKRYTRSFYRRFESGSLSSAEIILPVVFQIVKPESVLDFGCGIGTWLAAAKKLGARRLLGYDGMWVKPEMLVDSSIDFHQVDLETENIRFERVDLAICLEVAEHLTPRASERVIADLCKCSDAVLFSAAVPGQGGAHHINERWQSHWISLFDKHSFKAYDLVRPAIWNDPRVEVWYAQNCFLFVSQKAYELSARLQDTQVLISDIVHPRLLSQKIFHPNVKDEMRALAALPGAIWQFARRWL